MANPTGALRKASLKAQSKNQTSPLDNYRAAAAANPNDAQAQTNLGWGLYGAGQYAQAVEQFKRALTIDMNFLDAHYGLGLANKALGIKEPAVAAFNKVAELASQLDDKVRAGMLRRLAHGHINEIGTGDWQLAREIWHREA